MRHILRPVLNVCKSSVEARRVCLVRGPVKRPDRTIAKVYRAYGGDVSKLTDLVRCSLSFDSFANMQSFIEAFFGLCSFQTSQEPVASCRNISTACIWPSRIHSSIMPSVECSTDMRALAPQASSAPPSLLPGAQSASPAVPPGISTPRPGDPLDSVTGSLAWLPAPSASGAALSTPATALPAAPTSLTAPSPPHPDNRLFRIERIRNRFDSSYQSPSAYRDFSIKVTIGIQASMQGRYALAPVREWHEKASNPDGSARRNKSVSLFTCEVQLHHLGIQLPDENGAVHDNYVAMRNLISS